MISRPALLGWCGLLLLAVCANPSPAADWPQWGGRDCRNMVSDEKGLPDSFTPGEKKSGGGIDMATTKNVKWAVRVGAAAYGNPTVAGGRVFIGTDNFTLADDPRFHRTRGGLVKCLDEATGKLLWQLATPERTKVLPNTHFSQQHLGTCSSPTVEGDRVYVFTSAAEIVCLDVHGLADGNEGPFTDEAQYMAGTDNPPVALRPTDADILWRYDLIEELGVCPHDAASCSPLIHGDLLYTSTSNGVNAAHDPGCQPQSAGLHRLGQADRPAGGL